MIIKIVCIALISLNLIDARPSEHFKSDGKRDLAKVAKDIFYTGKDAFALGKDILLPVADVLKGGLGLVTAGFPFGGLLPRPTTTNGN